ncbi:MAG: dihydroxyacetone kinase phosphoryl donor subunit DhaM [Eubacteriaceae bacterium]
MSKTGFVIVSHSEKLADGLKDILEEMNQDHAVEIRAAGGTGDGRIGTNAVRIMEAIEDIQDCDNILCYADLGSSILSAETAIDMLDEDLAKKVQIVNCPLVEGAFLGVVQAPAAKNAEEIIKASQSASQMNKVQ